MKWTPSRPQRPIDSAGEYAEFLAVLRGRHVSGVYVIREAGRVLYVGESHTGRLYDTITRHFRKWKPRYGHAFDRGRVTLQWAETADSEAEAVQFGLVATLRPVLNTVHGTSGRGRVVVVHGGGDGFAA